jgi:hypothetical protein
LSWISGFPPDWPVTIYDKSAGGPRQRVHLGGWSSADGPSSGTLWPGAYALDNVGCESHTHMHHTVVHWDTLAETTVFLSGDAPSHVPDVIAETVEAVRQGVGYQPYGTHYVCNSDGKPHVDIPFPELRQGWELFYTATAMPDEFHWHGYGMYIVGRSRLQRWDLETWKAARSWCQTKMTSLAMERLYDTLFGE